MVLVWVSNVTGMLDELAHRRLLLDLERLGNSASPIFHTPDGTWDDILYDDLRLER